MNWEALNLCAPEYAKPSEPPILCGLIYAGKRHGLAGPPESAKTLVALIIILTAIRAGTPVAYIDFESGPSEIRRLLEDLGATPEEIRAVHYFEADGPPEGDDLQRCVISPGVKLTVIDSAIGAYNASDLDDEKRRDIEKWTDAWVRPLWLAGIATIVIDHVVKKVSDRGRFAIGSERKLGGVDVHLGLHAVKQLHRGADGLIRISTHKDRPGWLDRPSAAELALHSDPETHAITWAFRAAAEDAPETGTGWRPTVLMERISRHLEQHGAMNKTAIYAEVRGKQTGKVDAVRFLLSDGHAVPGEGNHRSPQIRIVKPYRDPFPNGSLGSPSADSPPFPGSPSLKEGNGNGNGNEHLDKDEVERLASLARSFEAPG